MRKYKINLSIIFCLFPFLLCAYTEHPFEQKFDSLYPYNLKYCLCTQYHPYRNAGLQKGWRAGHGLWYINGIKLDKTEFPYQIITATPQELRSCPDLGVGFSVDLLLKNTNWYYVDNREMFFYGKKLPKDTYFDSKQKMMIEELAYQFGVVKNIEFHRSLFKDPPILNKNKVKKNERSYVHDAFGTNYGILMSRNIYCINIPMTYSLTQNLVKELNKINNSIKESKGKKYLNMNFKYKKKKDNFYRWNVLSNNCIHPIQNAIAKSIGLVKTKRTDKSFLKQLPHMPGPSNFFYELEQSIHKKYIDVKKIYSNSILRKAFLLHNWSPLQHGTFIDRIKMHKKNKIFIEDDEMLPIPQSFPKFLKNGFISKQIRKFSKKSIYNFRKKKGPLPHYLYLQKKYQNVLNIITRRKKEYKYHNELEYQNFVNKFEDHVKRVQREVNFIIDDLNNNL